ncbi:hypothetical protein FKW77_008492 [Venturia effusa]|uniref:SRR1-like domain-containing protein n=1 Tax=Venturia effusa TaxID=50376 RepID=A0A517KZY1_9PEZI|nr:hypothetical protein FKW77_008492 [Venturia effusa]
MPIRPSIPDPSITLASLMQDYGEVLADYVDSSFRMSLRGELLDSDMFIDASFATGILSFSATRGPAYNNVQSANGRLIALYQLALFMDTVELSCMAEDKSYIQDDDFNDLDKEFLTILGLTVVNTDLELRHIIEEKILEQTQHTILTRDRAVEVQGYRDTGIIANVYNLAEICHSYRLPDFEVRSFVRPFDALAAHWPVEREAWESSSDGEVD